MATLAEYTASTRRLLRDESAGNIYSSTDVTAWINEAIQTRDLALRINRFKYTYTLTPSVFQYTFTQIQSGGTLVAGTPGSTPIDVLSVMVIPLGNPTSSPRYPMGRWAY